MTNRAHIKLLIKKVNEILYHVWDPIGVSKFNGPTNEYSSYALSIMKYVIDEDIEKLTEALTAIEKDLIGPLEIDDHNLKIALRLIQEKKDIEDGGRFSLLAKT